MAKTPTTTAVTRPPVLPENVAIWDELRTPDPKFTKSFDRGSFRGTATSPIYIARRMTEVFGPIGLGWGWDIDQIMLVPSEAPEAVFVQVTVWYKNPNPASVNNRDDVVEIGKITHFGGGQLMKFRKEKGQVKAVAVGYDDESVKGAVTDAISKALSYLGMSADIFMGLFDDVKYVRDTEKVFDKTDPIDPSSAAAERQNALQDAREADTSAESATEIARKEAKQKEERERADWLVAVTDDLKEIEATEQGYLKLGEIRDKVIRPKIKEWGEDDPSVQAARRAWVERRRMVEAAIGSDA